MKNALAILLFTISACFLGVSAHAQDLSQIDWSALADAEAACGPFNSKFVVKTQAGPHTLRQPDPGKALVYVVEEQKFKAVLDVAARVGLDGTWVGANRGDSYFVFSVEPGEHHLCTDWISSFLPNGRIVPLAPLIAEVGKTYYFRVRTSGGPGALGDGRWQSADAATIDLDPVNSDEAKLLIASSLLSVSHPKK